MRLRVVKDSARARQPSCNTLQLTATHCNTLQHTVCVHIIDILVVKHPVDTRADQKDLYHLEGTAATRCNTLQHAATRCNTRIHCNKERSIQFWRSRLQHTTTYCNTLQHTATHCNTQQHTATHSPTRVYVQLFPLARILSPSCDIALSTIQNGASQHFHCNTLQHTATHLSTSRCSISRGYIFPPSPST